MAGTGPRQTPVVRQSLVIRQTGPVSWAVILNGEDISDRLSRVTVHLRAGRPPQATLTWIVDDMEVEVEADD